MKIKDIEINGVAGIDEIKIEFNEGANIICGPNGIGKTTILECVSHIFTNYNTNILKSNVKSKSSNIDCKVYVEGSIKYHSIKFDTFRPEIKTYIQGLGKYGNNILSFKTTRTFNYSSLNAVGKDTEKSEYIMGEEACLGVQLTDIKNWFVNRYLYSAHDKSLSEEQMDNFDLAKKCFSLLDNTVSFSKVDASTNEILINTSNGEIYYEYLSSGFKAIIALLFGIIKEIEMRFVEPRIKAENFDGVILIDELELHLHPEWQGKVLGIIVEIFPKAQIIATTHSPHIIQSAEASQIIALAYDENLKIVRKELPNSVYGFKGWTIEEVLTDVMGMQDLRTNLFNSLIDEFQKAVEEIDIKKASTVYKKIDELLHPHNNLRKLLKFQLLGLGLNEND